MSSPTANEHFIILNALFILLVVSVCAGLLYRCAAPLTRSIRSLRLRFTVNGAIIGFSVGVFCYALASCLFPMLTVLSLDLSFTQSVALLFITTLVGCTIGAVWGIRLDGTRYLFGRVRRVFGEMKWTVVQHIKTSKDAKEFLAGNTIGRHSASPSTKTLILIYNSMFGMTLPLEELQLPTGCAFTANRRYLREASAVVFHIPTLRRPHSLRLHPGQLNVAWFMESGMQHPILNDPQFLNQFDLTMSFRRNADIWTPYYFPDFNQLVSTTSNRNAASPKSKDQLIALFFSYFSELSGRNTYVEEFMQHIDAHSYGRFLRNRTLSNDSGRTTKLKALSGYKFNLAYENSLEKDYVTEKFFDPLEVGCVPVYMGAPNIDDYAPGDHCYINAADFNGPKELAEYLLALNEDEDAYNAYHAWRHLPPRSQYLRFLEEQRTHPFVRLCKLIQNRPRDAALLQLNRKVKT